MVSSTMPQCLLATVPVVQPANLEGDPTLATEILPGPPSLVSIQQAAQRKDLKKALPVASYLPQSDPGSTYGAVSLSNGGLSQVAPAPIAGSETEGPRRKRLRVDNGGSRAQRASARRPPSPVLTGAAVEHALSLDGPLSSPPPIGDNLVQFPFPSPPAHPSESHMLASSQNGDVDASGADPSASEVGRRLRRVDKGKGKEKPVVRVKQEPIPISLTDAAPGPNSMANEDHCSACSAFGALVYCDGCPKAFHLWCLDPPMEAQELPGEDVGWYCPACRIREHPAPRPPPGLLSGLIQQVQSTPPTEFRLPGDIKAFFKDVTTAPDGSYVDTSGVKPPRLNRHGQLEDRDPHRLKDRNGLSVLCFKCGTSALPSGRLGGDPPPQKRPRRSSTLKADTPDVWKPIVSCDHCDLHWHLDCLNPPMMTMPPFGRKWMCPNHADRILPKRRTPRQNVQTIDITKPGQVNNGNVEVIASDFAAIPQQPFETEEVLINGRRYKIPERIIVLDFWGKISEQRSGPVRRPEPSSGSSSPLTSLSSLDGMDEDEANLAVSTSHIPRLPSPYSELNDQEVAELLCKMQRSEHLTGKPRMVNHNAQTEGVPPVIPSNKISTRPSRLRTVVSYAEEPLPVRKNGSTTGQQRNALAGPSSIRSVPPVSRPATASGRASPRPGRARKNSGKVTVKTEDIGSVIPPALVSTTTKRPRGRPRKYPKAVPASANGSASTSAPRPSVSQSAPIAATTAPISNPSTSKPLTIRLPRLSNLHAANGAAASASASAPAPNGARTSAGVRRSTRRQSTAANGISATAGNVSAASPLKYSRTMSDLSVESE